MSAPAAALLVALWRAGCTVRLDETGRIRYRAHGEPPAPALLARLATEKAGLVDLLTGPALADPPGWTLALVAEPCAGWADTAHRACIDLACALAAAGVPPAEVDTRAWWPVAAAVEEASARGVDFARAWGER